MPVTKFSEIEFKKKREKVSFKSITGENSQLVVFRYEKGEKTDHSHPMEQIGYVLSGEAEFFIEDETFTLKAGDAYHIPSGKRHGFNIISDTGLELIESYSPVKAENIY
ncbi:cupin domain-containing protein [Endozoicomonas sp. 4G]|uniref:cupin domain-containing protein n=1 Tax=Endozoicomonas sp. 4G TaxID=2872754 RepID=UPI002078E750|nr:cupin domain-containing protein [Endozoicomonas sp. 4G]